MKVTFETATLADCVTKAAAIAPNKGEAFDKASGIVIEITPDEDAPVLIRATNLLLMSMEWVNVLEVEGDTQSIWRLPSIMFAQVLKSLPIGSGKTVTLEDQVVGYGRVVNLTSGSIKAKFSLMTMEYYPQWDVFDPEGLSTVTDMGGRLAQVEWAADKTLSPLNGVHLDGTYAICTDRYKLAKTDLKIDVTEPVTVYAGLLGSILRKTGDVSFAIEDGQMLIMPDQHTQIRAVCLGEQYPNTGRIQREDWPAEVLLNKTPVVEMMQRASAFAGNDRFPVLHIYLGRGQFAVMMINEGTGHLGDVIEIAGQASHDRLHFRFNPRAIIEAIQTSPNEQIRFCYDPEALKGLVYIDGGSGYKCWVMARSETRPS